MDEKKYIISVKVRQGKTHSSQMLSYQAKVVNFYFGVRKIIHYDRSIEATIQFSL